MLHSAYSTLPNDILKIINSLKEKPVFVAKSFFTLKKIKQHFNRCSGHCTVECVLNMDLQEL